MISHDHCESISTTNSCLKIMSKCLTFTRTCIQMHTFSQFFINISIYKEEQEKKEKLFLIVWIIWNFKNAFHLFCPLNEWKQKQKIKTMPKKKQKEEEEDFIKKM